MSSEEDNTAAPAAQEALRLDNGDSQCDPKTESIVPSPEVASPPCKATGGMSNVVAEAGMATPSQQDGNASYIGPESLQDASGLLLAENASDKNTVTPDSGNDDQKPKATRYPLTQRDTSPLPGPRSPLAPIPPSKIALMDASAGALPLRSPHARKMPTSLARTSAPPDLSHEGLSEQNGAPRDLGKGLSRLARISLAPSNASSFVPEQSVRHVAEVPERAVYAAIVISLNALLMAIAEIIIEFLILGGVYPKLPFRLDFFFLTMLSALLGYQTLQGVRQGHFDTSRNALQVAALVESALIAGDIMYMVEQVDKYPASVPTRMPFLVLTALNLSLVIFLYIEMYLFHKDEEAIENAEKKHALESVDENSAEVMV